MLTKGQAACLVLDMIPTESNRELAKEQLKNTPFEVTFIYGSNPMEPVALARTKIEKDPFRYKTYPDTPPTTPKMSPMKSTDEIEIIDYEKSSCSTEEVSGINLK
ncbi:hypothetical protein G6F43_013198 [Rhizopus delemar]|nr:hypothetical protein G6F43_013198 [Rhizopus delemar]